MAKKEIVSEKREVFIPRASAGEDAAYFVGVNGVNYILPRGKKTLVPDFVADEVERSLAAEEAMYEERHKLQEKSK